jgi:hypothetical protein
MSQAENFVLFYGYNRKKHGDKAVFSNFYPASFQNSDGQKFLHTEQYMMWRKAVLFGDLEVAAKILVATKPQDCKALGRQVKNFNQTTWNENALQIMIDGLSLKFSDQNPELKSILLATGNKTLVEASPYDKIWGIGLKQTDPNCLDSSKWKGTNWLGISLMKTRNQMIISQSSISTDSTAPESCPNSEPAGHASSDQD